MALVYLSVEWGDLGLGATVPFLEDTGSSFSSDRHVKAVCAVMGTYGHGLCELMHGARACFGHTDPAWGCWVPALGRHVGAS